MDTSNRIQEPADDAVLDPNHVAHQLIEHIDRLEAFFGDMKEESAVSASSNEAATVDNKSAGTGIVLDATARQFLLGARAVMENGLLTILKEQWGIQRLPIKPGELFDQSKMLCEATVQTTDNELRDHVVKVTRPGYTFRSGKIYRLAKVLLYTTPN